jgi:hypothetical protein
MDKPAEYRIKVKGVVPESWCDRLGGMQIVAATPAETTLEGWLPDQAALNGVLDTLYGLHLPLLEVTCLLQNFRAQKERAIRNECRKVPNNETEL